ncbi:MAG: response regulator [Bacteroidetes bacterium]|jgi:DNA-binding response OmpR family regulator/two-component sensor histidine kinase|nr:response regulator [Bacteroidota bacterium]
MKKILVIEDDKLSLNVIMKTLRRAGYEAMGAASGSAGIKVAQDYKPDLIISDIMMEEMDGYEALAAIREQADTATIPFILMTGHASKQSMRHGMELGADDYLSKPFQVEELLAAVEARFEKQKAVQEEMDTRLDELRSSISTKLPATIRQPLFAMMNVGEELRSQAAALTPAQIEDLGEKLHQAGNRLERMFDNFLMYNHLQVIAADEQLAQQLREARSRSLKPLIEGEARKKAEHYGRRDDLQLNVQDGAVTIQRYYLVKLIEELLDNAFKYSSPGSPVRVTAAVREGTFILKIRDDGRGMTPEQVERVDAFNRSVAGIYQEDGIGLGLGIALRIATLYGGSVSIDSTPGEGTEAVVRLPAA